MTCRCYVVEGDHAQEPCEAMVLAILLPGPMTMDEVAVRLSEYSWSELFCARDAMSRRGEILMRRRGFAYELSVVTSGDGQPATDVAASASRT